MKKNTFNRICSAILAIVTVFVLIPAGMLPTFAEMPKIWDGVTTSGFSSGTGTEADPYIIKTAEQLAYLAKRVNAGTTYENKYIKLGADIVLNDTANWKNWGTTAPKNIWTAIGWCDNDSYRFDAFRGDFDGDGHIVSGIYINTASGYQGLFGYTWAATIQNLNVEKSFIKGGNHIGGIVGENFDGTVLNCCNTGAVSGTGEAIGGVVGCNNYGTVSDCYNTEMVSGASYVGGVVGENSHGPVSNCYNTGIVSYNTGIVNRTYGDIGGVVGYSNDEVRDCYNMGIVSGMGEAIGGVVGSLFGTLKNCYNTGAVSGDSCIGGVVGKLGDTMENSCNIGTVSGNSCVGGVVGYLSGTTSNCYNAGTASGDSYVGGVVGCIVSSPYAYTINCYYLLGCAKDGKGTVQYGIGNEEQGYTTADVNRKTKGLTDAEMKKGANFSGFDFIGLWAIEPETNSGYPYPVSEPVVNLPKTASSFASGTGTEEDPFLIKTAEQLAYLAKTVNEGKHYYGEFIRLENDIVIGELSKWGRSVGKTLPITWEAIGWEKQENGYYYSASFAGTFDGDGHTVSGIYIPAGASYQGLFGSAFNGIIRNVGITDSFICGNQYVGGVVGNNSDCTIENCYCTGVVIGDSYVGGVAGCSNGTIENCSNIGTVRGTSSVGGVVGYNYSSLNSNGYVSNCYNTGVVDGTSSVGGVVGKNDDETIKNCYNTGVVNGGGSLGGVVGMNSHGSVSNCNNTGMVNGTGGNIGGVVGCTDHGVVSNCNNTEMVSGASYVGGVVGKNSHGSVAWCYNTGTINGTRGDIGGVIGDNDGAVSNCYNTGAVNGTGSIGGVVGMNGSEVGNCYNIGMVDGTASVGGVVGYSDGRVKGCYNMGTVSGDYSVGGVVGFDYFLKTGNCYYLTGCVKDGNGVVQYGIGNEEQGQTTPDAPEKTAGLTDAQMKKKENFFSFDFETVWTIGKIEAYDYPTLQWQETVEFPKPHTHSYDSVVTASTCTEKGYTTHTCNCGENYVDSYTDALGHNYEWVIDKNATKTETGLKHEECTRCHAKRNENTVIPIVTCDHEGAKKVNGKDATCTEGGLKAYWHCNDCGKNFSDSACQLEIVGDLGAWKKIDKLGHNYVAVVTPPTKTERGYTTHTCSHCHDSYVDSYTDPIPAVTYGDINGDGVIDAFDYQMLKAFVLGTFKDVTDKQKEAMDVNHDGCADAFDYQMVKAHVLGTYVIQ